MQLLLLSTNDTEGLSTPVVQTNAGNNAVGLLSSCQSASPVFIHHFYQRLPHPLSHLLKELSVVDGTDVSILCDFLLKVLKIRHVVQMTDQEIYKIMYPYCRYELIALVTNAITAAESFEIFHVRIFEQPQTYSCDIPTHKKTYPPERPFLRYIHSHRLAAEM